MGRDGESALLVYRVNGGGCRHARLHPPLEIQADDMSVAAGNLFADYDVKPSAPGRMFRRAQCSLDRVVIGNRDHV
jgi:hypothetical protein